MDKKKILILGEGGVSEPITFEEYREYKKFEKQCNELLLPDTNYYYDYDYEDSEKKKFRRKPTNYTAPKPKRKKNKKTHR